MLVMLHRLSALCFYLLGLSFLVGWVMVRNNLWPVGAAVWLQVADLPLFFSAVLYGGTSLYRSIPNPMKSLPWMIAVPLGVFFTAVLVMNFWR